METKNFHDKSIESSIFQVEKTKKNGFKAFLNINSLPELFKWIKDELSPLERSCLIEYELQNHLIELCFIPNKFPKFRSLIEFVLQQIRNNTKFWIPNSDIFTEIYHRTDEKIEIDYQNDLEEKTQKLVKTDSSFEGIDNYLKYISSIITVKSNYKYVHNKELESPNNAIEIEKTNEIIINENDLNDDNVQEKNIQNDNEIYEKFIEFNDTQRLTRHQKKKLYDNPNVTSQEFNNYINKKNQILKEKKEKEIVNSIFMINRYMKHPKIEFQIFPYIYKFATKSIENFLNKKEEFHLQNFLFFLLLQEKQSKKKFRINQNLFTECQKETNQEINKVSQQETTQNEEIDDLTDFYTLCHSLVSCTIFLNKSIFLGFFSRKSIR